ncbi:hypothetical protein M9H77_27928 [Catharanthus roseus]|uniref:Uncharacterized protein n=1 Tax=Catharanthus roseus TaxID=4058 RepID=A0ACC0AFS7_CATRO|nr:hypothetical protein M9H77_27928 [Catharanthus roseus]
MKESQPIPAIANCRVLSDFTVQIRHFGWYSIFFRSAQHGPFRLITRRCLPRPWTGSLACGRVRCVLELRDETTGRRGKHRQRALDISHAIQNIYLQHSNPDSSRQAAEVVKSASHCQLQHD